MGRRARHRLPGRRRREATSTGTHSDGVTPFEQLSCQFLIDQGDRRRVGPVRRVEITSSQEARGVANSATPVDGPPGDQDNGFGMRNRSAQLMMVVAGTVAALRPVVSKGQ
jgi:hypothetical protein